MRERRQSHTWAWLTLAYETVPPGGDVTSPEAVEVIQYEKGHSD
mgnify:CR=1 FL=1